MAFAINQTGLIIVMVAVALSLFSATMAFSHFFKEAGDIEVCRLSVLAQHKLKTLGKSVVSLDCPRRNLEFFDNKVEINGKKAKEYAFTKLNEENVNRVIAAELASCWYKMGEGELDVFNRDFIAGLNRVCVICNEITFNDEISSQTFSNLDFYLKKETLSNSDTTYFNYLTKSQLDRYHTVAGQTLPWTQYSPFTDVGSTLSIDPEQSLSTEDQYIIYFLAWRPDWINERVFQAFDSAYYVGIGKTEDLAQYCNTLVT